MQPINSNQSTERWKRALGRLLDTRGFTVDEWRLAGLEVHREALVGAVQHILEHLRLQGTQTDLLERSTMAEDWNPYLREQFGDNAAVVREADPVGVAYGLRWCEILLNRHLDVEQVLDKPPEAVVQWTRDLA